MKKRRHIAILTLINPGHVYPTLGLCSELISRGYRVTYVADDSFADRIRQTGAEPVLFRIPQLTNAEKILMYPSSEDPRFWRIYAAIFCPLFLTLAAAIVAEVESFYRDNVPDLVIYDRFSFAGRILAKCLGAPAVHVWAHFAYRECLIRENGVCLNPEPILAFSHMLDSLMSAYGVDEKENLWHTEKLGIYFVPKEFQYDPDAFDERFCFVGPCMNRPARAAWKCNSGGRPTLLISESAASADSWFLKTCIDAFADSEYHVIFSVGGGSPPIEPSALPKNFEVNRDAYNTQILPHAALTICQAGMGTTLESLYFGVPVIGVPPTPYHSEVAYRVAELGLGVHLSVSNATPDSIRESADRVLQDPALPTRMKLMQRALRNSGGAAKAADHIEHFLNG